MLSRVIVFLLALAALVAPASAAAAQSVDWSGGAARPAAAALPADPNNFSFDSFSANYRLGRDSGGHATLETTEVLVAKFPDTDQNHGIQRTIPDHYQGHPTNLLIQSVTDNNGKKLAYSVDEDNGFTVVTIASDRFLHGAHSYRIRYSQENTVLFPKDSNDEEFYWDVNGTGWAQPFGTVTATLQMASDLVPALSGQRACYQGAEHTTGECASLTSAQNGAKITAVGHDVQPHQGITVVVGFAAGTFTPRNNSLLGSWVGVAELIAAILAVLGVIAAVIGRLTLWRSARGRGTVIAEYEPPAGVNVFLASTIHGEQSQATTAGILDLAVRGNLRVLETDDGAYELEILSLDGLDGDECELLASTFPAPEVGMTIALDAPNPDAAARIQALTSAVAERSTTDGYRKIVHGPLKRTLLITPWIAAAATVGFGVAALGQEVGGGLALGLIVVSVVLCFATISLSSKRPLTKKGVLLREHLEGLELYIKLAEADRLRVLQSPQGAERTPGGTSDSEILKLNERLLPYATLFGMEGRWSSVLGEYYSRTNAAPSWYLGPGVFNPVVFAVAIGALSSSVASSASFSGSAASSASSGFGGGGFSGGGGGGGGGGGI